MSAHDAKSVFGEAVKDQRFELGISQEELAHRAGLPGTCISDVERGAQNLPFESIERLARALEVSVSALFTRAGDGASRVRSIEILLVEDNPNDVELTLRAFRKAKITNVVHVARDGAGALDFVFAKGTCDRRRNQPPPGLILLDLNLPKITGLQVLGLIKADASRRNIPGIVLTSSNRDHDIAACRRLGIESYIVKPVDFRNLSELTPQLQFGWALVKPTGGGED
jgi:CheY-like chemotaxis protein